MGVSCEVNLIGGEPTADQEALYEQMIRTMQDDPAEFLIFEFMNAKNLPGTQQGLVFYQMCRQEGKICAEIRIDRADGMRMYARSMDDDTAAELLHAMIRTRTAPDPAGWEDITEQVLRGPDDADFE